MVQRESHLFPNKKNLYEHYFCQNSVANQNLLDLFNTNASIVRDLAKAAAESSPEAKILVISNPVCVPCRRKVASSQR